MAKPFRDLEKKLLAEHPESEARIAEYKRGIDAVLRLAEIRERRELTQADLAEALGVSQRRVSAIEHQDDLYLSTLRHYVEMLGGELKLVASFEDTELSIDLLKRPERS